MTRIGTRLWLATLFALAGAATISAPAMAAPPSLTMFGAGDSTPPVTVSDVPNEWRNHAYTVTLTATDEAGGSGVASTWYRIDGGVVQRGASVAIVAPADHSFDGAHTLSYYSVDAAGNKEAPHDRTFRIDTTPPWTNPRWSGVAQQLFAGGLWFIGGASCWLETSDESQSGVAATHYSLDGGAWSEGTTLSVNTAADRSQDGVHILTVYSEDKAGNTEAAREFTVSLTTGSYPRFVAAPSRPSIGVSGAACSGDRVIWFEQGAGSSSGDVRCWDAVSGTTQTVSDSPVFSDGGVAVEGDTVAWVDTGLRIHVADVSGGASTDVAGGYCPDLSGGLLTYVRSTGSSGVFVTDLSNGLETTVCADTGGPAWASWPHVSGTTVVWKDLRNGGSDIYGCDLATATEFAVCVASGRQEFPAISGDVVVWQDDRSGDWDIYGYDLGEQREFVIAAGAGDQTLPDVSGGLVVWSDDASGDRDILGRDLTDPTGKVLPVCVAAGPQNSPDISGSRVVWDDSDNDANPGFAMEVAGATVPAESWSASVELPAATSTTRTVTASLSAASPWGDLAWMRLRADSEWGGWYAYATSELATLPYGAGLHSVSAQFADDHGNLSPIVSAAVTLVDTQPPVTADDAPAGWRGADVTVSLTAVDDVSGIAETWFQEGDDAWQQGAACTILTSADHWNDGTYTINYYSVDVAGHQEAVKTCQVKIDTMAPQTASSVAAPSGSSASAPRSATAAKEASSSPLLQATTTYRGTRTLRLRPKDVDRRGRAASGVKSTKYSVNGGAWRAGKSATLKAPSAGHVKKYVVRYYSVDNLGHRESTRVRTVYIRG